jgi:hypothetical protein
MTAYTATNTLPSSDTGVMLPKGTHTHTQRERERERERRSSNNKRHFIEEFEKHSWNLAPR